MRPSIPAPGETRTDSFSDRRHPVSTGRPGRGRRVVVARGVGSSNAFRATAPHRARHRAARAAADHRRAIAVIRPERVPTDLVPLRVVVRDAQGRGAADARHADRAAGKGFTLRDATAFNVQFLRGRPILIDTLSFERAEPGAPWIAYRQFCEHFLAPLALMSHRDVRLGLLLRDHVDGVPLDLAARAPARSDALEPGTGRACSRHARAQRRYAGAAEEASAATKKGDRLARRARQALLDSLRRTVAKLDWKPEGTEWADYAENTSYGDAGAAAKDELVGRFLAEAAGGEVVWDLGANTGRFSRIAAGPPAGRRLGHRPGRRRANYRQVRRDGEEPDPAARPGPREPEPGSRLGERGAAVGGRSGRARDISSRSR